jgi:hypothetical protein
MTTPAPSPPAHSAPVAPPPARIRDDGARHAPPRAVTEAPAAPAAPVAPAAPPAPRSAFAMRAPDESPGVDVSPWRIAEGLVPAAPGTRAPGVAPTRAPPRDTGPEELQRQRDGSYRSEHSTFTAKVAADGTVKFEDAPIVRPGTGADQSGPAGARDPSMRGGGIEGAGAGGVGGTMDVTEMMMRRRGVDPHAHEKLAFLDRTRDERAAIAADHKSTQLSKSGRLMRRTLEEMWASTRDPVERKQALFELWDECAETGDPATIAGAQQARAEIMSFIRARLRGPDAYTPAEVARFNARKQSRARFAPGTG